MARDKTVSPTTIEALLDGGVRHDPFPLLGFRARYVVPEVLSTLMQHFSSPLT
jgi:hypothetical protein